MIENIEIDGVEKKVGQSGKSYFSINTSLGRMGCFEAGEIAKLQQSIGKTMSVDYVQNDKGFKNIRKVLGEAKVTAIEAKKTYGKGYDSNAMYVSYAKDIFLAIITELKGNGKKDLGVLMAQACALVKKAKLLIENENIEPEELENDVDEAMEARADAELNKMAEDY